MTTAATPHPSPWNALRSMDYSTEIPVFRDKAATAHNIVTIGGYSTMFDCWRSALTVFQRPSFLLGLHTDAQVVETLRQQGNTGTEHVSWNWPSAGLTAVHRFMAAGIDLVIDCQDDFPSQVAALVTLWPHLALGALWLIARGSRYHLDRFSAFFPAIAARDADGADVLLITKPAKQ